MIISISNFKGGVGKTTSCLNIGAGLAKKGKRVLLIDLDPQFNLTQSLNCNEETEDNIYNVLKDGRPLSPIEISKKLHLVPATLDLIKAEVELSHRFKRESILNKALEAVIDTYDYVIIDCPPSLGVLTINGFVASDLIFVPIEAEFLSLKGFSVLSEAIGKVGLKIDRAFITKFDSRKVLNRNVKEAIVNSLGPSAFKTVIRHNVSLAEAPARGESIFDYAPKSYGAKDYAALVNEIIKSYG